MPFGLQLVEVLLFLILNWRVAGNPDRYKAIDFDRAVKIGEDISSAQVAVTYGYVSPEIAKLYHARASGSSAKIVAREDASMRNLKCFYPETINFNRELPV